VKRLCASDELRAGGSLRFPLAPLQGRFGPLRVEGFAHRAPDGTVRAWLNVCPHRAEALDVGDGRLFNAAGEIECHAHGARFDAATGACAGGPCEGGALSAVAVEERDGTIYTATEASSEPHS
jgi:nitrite reductase/ring-hydroxylating ferredoxin subunit